MRRRWRRLVRWYRWRRLYRWTCPSAICEAPAPMYCREIYEMDIRSGIPKAKCCPRAVALYGSGAEKERALRSFGL